MRELDCNDPYDLETLYRGSLKVLPDGSVAQQVLRVGGSPSICATDPGSANAFVTGAGNPDSTGTYVLSGDNDGHGIYIKPGWTMIYIAGGMPFPWSLFSDDFSSVYVATDAQYPWDVGWLISTPGINPPPTVSCSEP